MYDFGGNQLFPFIYRKKNRQIYHDLVQTSADGMTCVLCLGILCTYAYAVSISICIYRRGMAIAHNILCININNVLFNTNGMHKSYNSYVYIYCISGRNVEIHHVMCPQHIHHAPLLWYIHTTYYMYSIATQVSMSTSHYSQPTLFC